LGYEKNHLAVSKLLIANGANIDRKDSDGTPIIHYAVANKSKEMIQLFIESKVNLKAKDRYGLTALVYALKAKNTEIVDIIKNAGGSY
jgi:ankyrin repeat protein